jgi:hypothetical protein
MSPDLVLRYRHQPATALPHFVGKSDAEDVASQVRRQLGVDDADAPALSLARLTEIGRIRVNGVALDLIWSTDHEVTDGHGNPVLGVCEHVPDIPDSALININPHVAMAARRFC